MPVAHVAVALERDGWTSPHSFPLMVMQTLIGSYNRMTSSGKNMNSELAQAAAAGQLCHSFSAFNTAYKDTGLFGVSFVAEPNKVQDMAFQTMESLVRMCHNVTSEEVRLAAMPRRCLDDWFAACIASAAVCVCVCLGGGVCGRGANEFVASYECVLFDGHVCVFRSHVPSPSSRPVC